MFSERQPLGQRLPAAVKGGEGVCLIGLLSVVKADIITLRELTKGNGGYFFTSLSRKGKEVGIMTLYDMLSLLIIATGFMLAITKK